MKPHGTRARYHHGCRCFSCRLACAQYQVEYRKRREAGIRIMRPIGKAQRHLLKLKKHGIGRRLIAEITGLSDRSVFMIIKGRVKLIRPETEAKILSVTKEAVAGGSNIPAGPTKVKLNHLLRDGFTKIELARRFGLKNGLQMRKKMIKGSTAMRIERFYNKVMAA